MRLRWLMTLLACLLVAGCVSVPTTGPVKPGLPGQVQGVREPLVRPIANPPRPDMTQVEVVAGFLDAVAAVGDDYQVARQYLTTDAAASWNPGAGVTVMAPDAPELAAENDAVTASYTQVASVSASGVSTQLAPVAGSTLFPMAAIDGQWRIAQAPPGLLLGRLDLQRAFEARNAYFMDPGGTIAVPDVRLVPRTGPEALATALVGALLAGPSQWIAPAVSSAIPEGLQLTLGAVPVTDGVARVELQGQAVTLDEATAQRFGAQFAWTLSQVPGLTAFEISLGGVPAPLRVQRGPVPLSQFSGFDPDVLPGEARLYGLTAGGDVAMVADDQVRTVRSSLSESASSISVSPDQATLAEVNVDRTGVLIGSLRSDATGGQLLAGPVANGPSIDAGNRVWWTNPQGQVLVALPDAQGRYSASVVAVVDSPGPVRVVRPSRDGTRVALVMDQGGRTSAYLAVLAGGAQALQIEGLRPFGADSGVADLSWRSADEVTVLRPEAEIVARHDLLGSLVAAFPVPDSTRTVTDAPQVAVVVGLDGGTAGPLTGSGVRTIEGLSAPAYPG